MNSQPSSLLRDVSAYTETVFQRKNSKYCLVIPVINEGERIRRQINAIAEINPKIDVIISDGGSTDGSLNEEHLSHKGVRALLVKTGPGKLSAQLRIAYSWALDEGYAGIVTIDGNGKDNVEAIADFVRKLDEGYDYVQGSRYARGGRAENTPIDRTLANRLIHAPLMSIAGRHWFTDTTNGYRAYSRRYLEDVRVAPFRDVFQKYELLFYLTVRAGQLGYRVCETPVRRSYPVGSPTPTKIGGLSAKLAVLEQAITAARGGYAP